ncbi:CysZ protein [Desulfocicer vacuolatum DSM 3385]|uniref:CysZ protein n=1 Tax=Desulfocicer vacuolatum DSM 3385 TaxID=1121400 RepID=A0A1W2B701_9BACT|nr:EI24 domain-containing protein [Desulfocicer vacuolatum]SMC68570.1 CysZ protein [Desulfocicer vacuolatum DSM 3385]
MNFIKGIVYNFRGLLMGMRTPGLLMLGLLRFVMVIIISMALAGSIMVWHREILNMIWTMPESGWLIYIWTALSWLLSIFLVMLSSLIAYLIAQVFFCVFIMDLMSRITEKIIKGETHGPVEKMSLLRTVFHLICQEIPRAVIPMVLMLVLMVVGLLTPLGPGVAVVSALVAGAFLAWDNTDLVPARRMNTFAVRFRYFKKNILFHLGFGICFLIPWLNILFLSFAPVGATLFFIENEDE